MNATFYILDSADSNRVLLFCCKLIAKLQKAHEQLYIEAGTNVLAKQVDALLWTFSDISFIPHQLVNTKTSAPVLIGFPENIMPQGHALVNLNATIGEHCHAFPTIYEIVMNQAEAQHMARLRYKRYRELNFTLSTHKVSALALEPAS